MTDQPKQARRGCLFYGGIAGAVLLLVCALAIFLGVRYAKNLVENYTDPEPATLPTVRLSDEDSDRLIDKVEDFRDAVRQGRPTEPLELTADELNAMIARERSLMPLRERLYVTIPGNELQAQMSIPAEELGLDSLKGRYVNATGTFDASIRQETLSVVARSLTVKGKPLPEPLMREIRARNLVQDLNLEPQVQVALEKIERIDVKDGKLVIVPKPPN